MNTDNVKGFSDFTEKEAEKRETIRRIIEDTFKTYCFEPAETPIVEYEEFVRGNNQQDEAVSDIFKLEDKGKRKLALRYEFTFQLKRISNNKKFPFRRYQIGPVFRDEPVTSNRFRQFTQCDADIIGAGLKDEAEILCLTSDIFDKLGIKTTIYVNNRKLLNEIMEKAGIVASREQAMKELDKIGKIPDKEIEENLKKIGAGKLMAIMKKPEKNFEKYDNYKEIKELKELAKEYGLKLEFSPTLVRGLSYYNGSIFEIKTKEVKETIAGGGSYLINGVQATGISFGLERISSLAKIEKKETKFLVVSLNRDEDCISLVQDLRKKGKSSMIMFGKPSKALEYANAKEISYVILAGTDEGKKFKLRDMKTGKEKLVGKEEVLKII